MLIDKDSIHLIEGMGWQRIWRKITNKIDINNLRFADIILVAKNPTAATNAEWLTLPKHKSRSKNEQE